MESDEAARVGNLQPTTASMEDPDKEREEAAAPETTAASSSSAPPRMDHNNNSFIGKHRMAASIANLQNEIKLFQEELEKLETLGVSSTGCKELVFAVESAPDPLLPLTKGPVDVDWDRWFRGVHNPRRRWL